MNDLDAGKQALNYFWMHSRNYSGVPKTFEAFAAIYGKKFEIYCEGLGLAINQNGLSPTQVNLAMQNLANQARGKIPKDHNSYFAAISGQASKIDYLDLTLTVAKDVAVQTANGAAALGDSVLSVFKIATFALPFVAVYVGYIYLQKLRGKK